MFSTDGLSQGEIVVVSGLFAMGMLMIASVIGVIVALVATREPRVETTAVRAPAPARQRSACRPSREQAPGPRWSRRGARASRRGP